MNLMAGIKSIPVKILVHVLAIAGLLTLFKFEFGEPWIETTVLLFGTAVILLALVGVKAFSDIRRSSTKYLTYISIFFIVSMGLVGMFGILLMNYPIFLHKIATFLLLPGL